MSNRFRQWSLAACVVGALAASAGPPSVPVDSLPPRLDFESIPLGLEGKRSVPAENPLTAAKVSLGRRLFFDRMLSADKTVACASCHRPDHGFSDPEPAAIGIGGRKGTRNAPSLLNRALGRSFFWDGRVDSLEGQALHPIANPLEMGSDVQPILERLRSHPEYPRLFQAAFGGEITAETLARALASFERVILTGNTRVDRFRAGELTALDDSERHGVWLYESRGRCWRCHTGANFSDEGFHNTGVSWGKNPADLGRFEVTKKDIDRGRFKTPTLRGLVHTGPYMHDGSMKSLEEVVRFYNRGGLKNPNLDEAMAPLGLSENDERDLVAFLKALSEPRGVAKPDR